MNTDSGKCLNDPASATANGTQFTIWSCDGKPNQLWSLPPSPVTTELPGTCLSGHGTDAPNVSVVALARCASPQTPTAAQEWTFDGRTLRSQGKCLNVRGRGTATGTAVTIWNCLRRRRTAVARTGGRPVP